MSHTSRPLDLRNSHFKANEEANDEANDEPKDKSNDEANDESNDDANNELSAAFFAFLIAVRPFVISLRDNLERNTSSVFDSLLIKVYDLFHISNTLFGRILSIVVLEKIDLLVENLG